MFTAESDSERILKIG